MDLAIEANRNSALFNTMQQVLDVYNPLLHKARPTVVNETKHRIYVQPSSWANTLSTWNGAQSVRFDLPRIGSLTDFSLQCAFRFPGVTPSIEIYNTYGYKGVAKPSIKVGDITDNTNTVTNNARGRLDRIYADRLIGFNMIQRYTVSSKSRRIFTGTGEYLLTRFSQMDEDTKQTITKAITPVNVFGDMDDSFYSPGIGYNMTIPLFMFFNEHITSALDVNFSEEVHIEFELRPPSSLFYYGQLGNLQRYTNVSAGIGALQKYTGGSNISWDQSNTDGTIGFAAADFSTNQAQISIMQDFALRHIRGVGPPYDDEGSAYGTQIGPLVSGPTFMFPDVDSNGESVQIQFQGSADYIVQDTDAYRALREQMFPEGTGLTTISYDTAQEVYHNMMSGTSMSGNLLDARSDGGQFIDPSLSPSGLTKGDSTRFVDLNLRSNHLTLATHFMVRKHSDLGGDGNTQAGTTSTAPLVGETAPSNVLGAFRIYTRCLPVHSFQVLAAGRVIYESDGDTQLNLTQTNMYNGTGLDWAIPAKNQEAIDQVVGSGTKGSGRPFNVYSINWGLQASRLENSGCLSLQNLNNPVLRIYFKPDTWAEYCQGANSTTSLSDAAVGAAKGVQIDVIHEFFNVVTINSGNGEITTGLNQ